MGRCGAMNIKAEADEDIEIGRDGAPRKVCEPGFRTVSTVPDVGSKEVNESSAHGR